MVGIFLLRIDTVTGKGEGEIYYPKEKWIIKCNVWTSHKLVENEIIIAKGKKAINKVFNEYIDKGYHITEA